MPAIEGTRRPLGLMINTWPVVMKVTRSWVALIVLQVVTCSVAGAAMPRSNAPVQPAATQLRTPTARIHLGWDTDDIDALAGGAGTGWKQSRYYVVRASAAGVVEFVRAGDTLVRRGDPLVRLYDANVLSELRAAARMMRHYVRPFVFRGSRPGREQPAQETGVRANGSPSPRTRAQTQEREQSEAGLVRLPDPPPVRSGRTRPPARRPRNEQDSADASSRQGAKRAAQAEVEAARKCLENLQAELQARRRLCEAGIMSPDDVQQFERRVDKARQELKAARRRLAALGGSVSQAPAESVPTSPPQPREATASHDDRQPAGPGVSLIQRLAAPRWQDQLAPSDGVITRWIARPGQRVRRGDALVEIANTDWVCLYAYVPEELGWRFVPGTPVTITFDDYPGVEFRGWIRELGREQDDPNLRVEMVVYCRSGYYADNAYSTLLWLALAAPISGTAEEMRPEPLQSARASLQKSATLEMPSLMTHLLPPPLAGLWHLRQERDPSSDSFVGPLGLVAVKPVAPVNLTPAQESRRRLLEQLRRHRQSFVEGLTTTIFNKQVVLTYPRHGEIARAIERMAAGKVSHHPNMCAQTMRQALGWGLGDAAQWAVRLPERGYRIRSDGVPRPGDILVWPFTYGPNHTQHIGIAVQQGGKMMLLSNLNGKLCTSDILGGYIAFYKPKTGAG